MPAMLQAALAGVLALAGNAAALAQPTVVPDEPDAAISACLTPKGNEGTKVEYPNSMLDWKATGTVRLRMEFFDPDKPPRTTVLYSSNEPFEEAARTRVREYRLPCLKPGSTPVVFLQEFSFDSRDGRRVSWDGPQAAGARGDCELNGVKSSDLIYPARALHKNVTGVALTEARFEASGEAPSSVTVLNPVAGDLAFAATSYMKNARLVCKEPSGRWLKTVHQPFNFHVEGAAGVVFKDMSFVQFLGAVDKIETHRVRFDLDSMACPFDLDLVLYQPYAANSVGEVGQTDPNRQALLAWLRTVQLRIPPVTLKQVLGDTIRITVPCGLVDLTS